MCERGNYASWPRAVTELRVSEVLIYCASLVSHAESLVEQSFIEPTHQHTIMVMLTFVESGVAKLT